MDCPDKNFSITPWWSRRKMFYLPKLFSTTAVILDAVLRAWCLIDGRIFIPWQLSPPISTQPLKLKSGFSSVEAGRDWCGISYLLPNTQVRTITFKLVPVYWKRYMLRWQMPRSHTEFHDKAEQIGHRSLSVILLDKPLLASDLVNLEAPMRHIDQDGIKTSPVIRRLTHPQATVLGLPHVMQCWRNCCWPN